MTCVGTFFLDPGIVGPWSGKQYAEDSGGSGVSISTLITFLRWVCGNGVLMVELV